MSKSKNVPLEDNITFRLLVKQLKEMKSTGKRLPTEEDILNLSVIQPNGHMTDFEAEERITETIKEELSKLPIEDREAALNILNTIIGTFDDLSPALKSTIKKFIDENEQSGT